MNGTQMERIPRLLQLISFMRNVGPLRVGPERSQRRLVAKLGGDMPHLENRSGSLGDHRGADSPPPPTECVTRQSPTGRGARSSLCSVLGRTGW